MVLSALLAAALAGACLLGAEGANPLVPASMADPHIRIFNDRAYLYSGWDADKTSKGFNMPSWRIYSSDDLMEWTLETTIEPTQTWVGNSTACWATDCVYHNGAYYFFFSNHSYDIGVLRAPTPTGPFVDVLGRPLFPANATGFKQYDPTIFFDDVDSKFYIAFGLNQALQNNSFYFVAELADDMLSLAETPRRISFTGVDAPSDDTNPRYTNSTAPSTSPQARTSPRLPHPMGPSRTLGALAIRRASMGCKARRTATTSSFATNGITCRATLWTPPTAGARAG